jgi:hypothetical protein
MSASLRSSSHERVASFVELRARRFALGEKSLPFLTALIASYVIETAGCILRAARRCGVECEDSRKLSPRYVYRVVAYDTLE